jgi:hypothetical protein
MFISDVTLLSVKQYQMYKKHSKDIPGRWWLRGPGETDSEYCVACVDGNKLNKRGSVVNDPLTCVRPVMVFEDYTPAPGQVISFDLLPWTVIGDGLALCDVYLCQMPFISDFSDFASSRCTEYESSRICKYLEDRFFPEDKDEDNN